ncbi:DUF6747 family protein [Pareuzebyella sediminis]|uniref:DUF6747 family protein n=1 Tax=Pareuzebyella sediminis TaxID=2607998 RepID=UPI0018E16023|nr:DUF6747 family protein [Pareuzebyella sediminis]
MKTVLLLKEIYLEGFRNIGNYIVRNYFKVFTWFTIVLLGVVSYAFLYRLVTGFAFD